MTHEARMDVVAQGRLAPDTQAPDRVSGAARHALRDHLTAPLKDGGHGLSEASYTVVWCDNEQFHDWDHNGGTWFNEALLHSHDSEVSP